MHAPDYIEVVLEVVNTSQTDLLVALLSNYGFEGFEEEELQVKAYIKEREFNESTLAELLKQHQLNYQIHKIQSQNWNAVWEEQFEPVQVNDFAGIRAHFHPSFGGKVAHDLVITPKMSFGTGHHATTWMMVEQMQHINFTGMQVLDFGTGTGILAILSEKLGAAHVLAIDIDEWSIENAKENVERNNCHAIQVQQADEVALGLKYDVILANINKHVILQNIQQLAHSLADNGCLLISGLLDHDEADIQAATSLAKLNHCITIHRQQWIAMRFGS